MWELWEKEAQHSFLSLRLRMEKDRRGSKRGKQTALLEFHWKNGWSLPLGMGSLRVTLNRRPEGALAHLCSARTSAWLYAWDFVQTEWCKLSGGDDRQTDIEEVTWVPGQSLWSRQWSRGDWARSAEMTVMIYTHVLSGKAKHLPMLHHTVILTVLWRK